MPPVLIPLLAILASLIASPAISKDDLHRWPISAEVVRVIDGDTVVVDAQVWPQVVIAGASIRVLGIDTPELHGKCDAEKAMAKEAKAMMADAFPPSTQVQLLGVKPDKYGGRFNARVLRADGQSWQELLFDVDLAAPYDGQGPKRDWCAAIPDPPKSN